MGAGASSVAAGMLAPVSEAEVGHAELLERRARGRARCGPSSPRARRRRCTTAGTLIVARDRDEAEALDRERAFRERLGPARRAAAAERRAPARARARARPSASRCTSPTTAPSTRARSSTALRRARRGPRGRRRRAPLDDVDADARRRGRRRVVRRARRRPRPPGEGPDPAPARPGTAPGLVERVLRFEGGYLVPRGDGRYVLGATVEERGFDTTVTAGGLYELLRDATEIVPGISELVVEEASGRPAPRHAGQRPDRARGGPRRRSPPATSATASCSPRSPPSASRRAMLAAPAVPA